jgi:hypothetical protein
MLHLSVAISHRPRIMYWDRSGLESLRLIPDRVCRETSCLPLNSVHHFVLNEDGLADAAQSRILTDFKATWELIDNEIDVKHRLPVDLQWLMLL